MRFTKTCYEANSYVCLESERNVIRVLPIRSWVLLSETGACVQILGEIEKNPQKSNYLFTTKDLHIPHLNISFLISVLGYC